MKKIGFIGYGLRSETMMKAFAGIGAEIEAAAIADLRAGEIREKVAADSRFAHTRYYADAAEMLAAEPLDGVFIGTRCGLHASLAAQVLARDLPLFLEKPVCISEEQYDQLARAGQGKEDRVVVSFPLRLTDPVQQMKHLADSGELGDIVSVQAVNNVPYGSVYYHSWYRDPSLTGGLFLQKTTHDIDYITYILGKQPEQVYAETAKMHFKGDKPAGLHCPDCPEYHTCPESSFTVRHTRKEEPTGDACCFARDTGNEDVGAALFRCGDGTILSYHQIFLVKGEAGRRGARFVGTRASAEFDFYTARLRVDYYDGRRGAEYQFHCPPGLQHFGGDEELAKEFLAVMEGAPSRSNLAQGLASAAACLAAKRSAECGMPVRIQR